MYTYEIIYSLVFLVIIAIVLIVKFTHTSNTKNAQDSINSQVESKIKASKYNFSKRIYINDFATWNQPNIYKKFIGIDYENKKLALIDYTTAQLYIADFQEVVDYEIYENSSAITAGGHLGLYTGVFAAETAGNCKELRLIIKLNQLEKPQISYDLITSDSLGNGIGKNSKEYKQVMSSLQEIAAFLDTLKRQNINQ